MQHNKLKKIFKSHNVFSPGTVNNKSITENILENSLKGKARSIKENFQLI